MVRSRKRSDPVAPQVNEQLHEWLTIVNGVYRTAHGTAAIAAGCKYARNKAISRVAARHRFIESLLGGASLAVIAFHWWGAEAVNLPSGVILLHSLGNSPPYTRRILRVVLGFFPLTHPASRQMLYRAFTRCVSLSRRISLRTLLTQNQTFLYRN